LGVGRSPERDVGNEGVIDAVIAGEVRASAGELSPIAGDISKGVVKTVD
jgi:hypothetical protein